MRLALLVVFLGRQFSIEGRAIDWYQSTQPSSTWYRFPA